MIRDSKGRIMKSLVKLTGPIICECGCGGSIPLKPWHTDKRVPRFIHGHHRVPNPRKEWMNNQLSPACKCGCGERIKVQWHHKDYKIPEYILGHNERGKHHPYAAEINRTPEKRLKFREMKIAYIEKTKLKGLPVHPTVGFQEKAILDRLEEYFCYPIHRQYKVGGFFLDGYCSALRLAIEIDEPYHKGTRQREKDLIRDTFLQERSGINTIRIPVEVV